MFTRNSPVVAQMRRTWTLSETSALARLFSSGVIRELAQRGHSPLLGRLLSELNLSGSLPSASTLGDFLDWAFSEFRKRDNRHEYIYKNAIAQKVLLGVHSLNTACMLTEFRAGECKADVVILNGTSTVYEIKSERDDLGRLERQLAEYLKVFQYVQVITGEKRLGALERLVPNEVGIQVLTGRYTIQEHRSASSNIPNIFPEQVFESLQRSEYLAILDRYGIPVPDVPNTQIHSVAKRLFVSLTAEQAHQGMVDVLKETRNPMALREFIQSVPDALKAAAISVPLAKSERSRLLEALTTDLQTAFNWA